MLRSIGAVVAGFLTVMLVVVSLQVLSARIHPLPAGLNPMDPANADALAAHMEAMPATAWSLAFGSELLGAFLGALAAGAIATSRVRVFSGAIVALALAGSVNNWTSFAHPTWFVVGQLVAYPIVLAAAWALLARRRPAVS